MGNEDVLYWCLMLPISHPCSFCFFLALNCNVCFIVTNSGTRKALTLYLEQSQQSGTNGATHSVVQIFLKTSSLWLGPDTKGGIDVRKDWSLVLCPPELAEETALSQTLIQNANGSTSWTWETYSTPIFIWALCSTLVNTQHRHLRNYAVLNVKVIFKQSLKDAKIQYLFFFFNSGCQQLFVSVLYRQHAVM